MERFSEPLTKKEEYSTKIMIINYFIIERRLLLNNKKIIQTKRIGCT